MSAGRKKQVIVSTSCYLLLGVTHEADLSVAFKYKCELSIFLVELCTERKEIVPFAENLSSKLVYLNWLTCLKLKAFEVEFIFWRDKIVQKSF